MLNGRLLLSILFAVVLAILSSLLIFKLVSPPPPVVAPQDPAPTKSSKLTILVAATDIPYLKTLSETDLRPHLMTAEDLPNEPPSYFSDPKELVGQVAMTALKKGSLIQRSDTKPHENGSPLALEVRPQFRAVTLRVDDVKGVAGFLLRGNLVDVVAIKREKDSAVDESQLIAEALRVLAIDQEVSQTSDKPQVVRSVTVEAPPKQAEALSEAQISGSIQLLLRNPEDVTASKQPKQTPTELPPMLRIIKGQDHGPAETTVCPENEVCLTQKDKPK